MKTITRHAIVVEHDGRDYEVPAMPPVAEWFDPLVTATSTELHVTYLAVDDDAGGWANPLDDNEGVTYKLFDNGSERNDWVDDFSDGSGDPDVAQAMHEHRFFWLERYEHGLVRYALCSESSVVDRRWDVIEGVGWIMLDKEWFGGDATPEQYIEIARALCEEFTSWCNGDVYGVVHVTLDLITGDEIDTESCWGYIGSDYAEACAREEHS